MPQKTIIVGMGSQGYAVCDQLSRRIESEFGSLDRVPWLRMLVFETEAAIGASRLGQEGVGRHIGIDATTFGDMVGSPQKYEESIDLPNWADAASLAAGGVPTNGANNRRMTGRLCWLAPDNFSVFDDAFRRTYHELAQLTPAEATNRRGTLRDGTNPAVAFAAAGANAAQSVRVFVVGTLAGGTNSGSFVDIGYYLQTIEGIASSLDVVGVFSVPHAAYAVPVHWGNAYGGLTELNHFHVQGKRYSAKFANRRERTGSSLPPFGTTMVVQPRGGGGQQVELGQLVHALTEVLHLSAVSQTGNSIEATLVNAKGNYSNERDLDGRPMPYATLGASAVVFPVEHILDACAARLACEALDEVLQSRALPDGEVGSLMLKLAVDAEAYQERMVAQPAVEDYLRDLGRQASQAAKAALRGDRNALPNIDVAVKGKIAQAFHSWDQNFQGDFRESIHAVAESLAKERVEELGRQVDRMARSPSMGVVWAERTLDALERGLQDRASELRTPKTDIGVRVAAQASEDRAKHLAKELEEKKGCLPFGAKAKRQAVASEWVKATQDHWRASFLIESEAFEKEAVDRLTEACRRYRSRLSDPHNGLRQFLERVRDRLGALARALDEAGPIVNGLALFEPNKTVREEFVRSLKNSAAEATARADVRSKLEPWFVEVQKAHGISAYDRPRPAEPHDVELALGHGRPPFAGLHAERVERRLVAWPNWQAELRQVANAGRVFLELDPSRNQHGVPPTPDNLRRPACAYFHAAQASDPNSDEGRVATVLRGTAFPLRDSQDPHRILFTEALAVFSLFSIRGVEAHRSSYSDERRSRRDVAWQPLDGSRLDEQQDYHIGLLLAGMALGTVEFRPSGPFSFATLATPTHPARAFQVDRDLADAAYHLGRNHLEAEDLSKRVRAEIQGDLPSAAERVRDFNVQAGQWNFHIEGQPVDNQLAFERLLPFARTVPGLIPAVVGLFGATYTPPSVGQFYSAGTGVPGTWDANPAFRCDRCHQFLAPYSPNATLDLIPERCPGCGKVLRLDLLVGGSG